MPSSTLGIVASSITFPVVTGGTLTSDTTYYYRTFTSNGTLGVSQMPLTMDYIVVGGGAGSAIYGGTPGGANTFWYSQAGTKNIYAAQSGGAGGEVLSVTARSFPIGSHTVTIGGGGSSSGNGTSSSVVAAGSAFSTTSGYGTAGTSLKGGDTVNSAGTVIYSGGSPYFYRLGAQATAYPTYQPGVHTGGGGAGAGGPGYTYQAGGGNGGYPLYNWDNSVDYGAGAGACAGGYAGGLDFWNITWADAYPYSWCADSMRGSSPGGQNPYGSSSGVNAPANRGGGGGAAWGVNSAGGSGVVIFRYTRASVGG